MNRSEFVAMAKDVKEHPERLAEYRKIYKNVYPFSDGIFKMLIYLIEIEKFFAIEDRTPPEERELSDKAEMLRIFRDVLEEKEIPEEKLKKLLDKDFVKDVSLEEYTDETLLNEVDGMTNILYEKQGSYLQGQEDMVKAMLAEGVSVDIVMRVSKFSEEKILKLQAEIARERTTA